jgi:hypothetical protein
MVSKSLFFDYASRPMVKKAGGGEKYASNRLPISGGTSFEMASTNRLVG